MATAYHFPFVNIVTHPVMNAHWLAGYDIEYNSISNGIVFSFHDFDGPLGSAPQIDSVTEIHNTLTTVTQISLGTITVIGTTTTSPNP